MPSAANNRRRQLGVKYRLKAPVGCHRVITPSQRAKPDEAEINQEHKQLKNIKT